MNELKKQYIRKYKIDRVRLIKGIKHSIYDHEDILVPVIMQSNLSDSKTIKFKSDLGFNQISLILSNQNIQRRRYTNSIHCFRLQDWSLFL